MSNQNAKLNEKLEALNLQKEKAEQELNNIKAQINQVKEELAKIKRDEKQKEKDTASKRRKDFYVKKREEKNITFEDMELFNHYLLGYPSSNYFFGRVVENKANSIPDKLLIEISNFIKHIKAGKEPKLPKRVERWIRQDWERK